jgi:hypothetical protein
VHLPNLAKGHVSRARPTRPNKRGLFSRYLLLPVFLAGAESLRVVAVSRVGEADRVRRDRRERPRRGGRELDNTGAEEDGFVQSADSMTDEPA